MYTFTSNRTSKQTCIVVIDYGEPLELLNEFFQKTHLPVSQEDLIQLFKEIIQDYFLEHGHFSSRMMLKDIAGEMGDYIESNAPLSDAALEIFEAIDEITRYYWPGYSALRAGVGIEDVALRGDYVVLLSINKGVL